jgi:hypothetical protein
MSTPFKYSGERKSHQSLNQVYFRTSVIKDWKTFTEGGCNENDRYTKFSMAGAA